ncbi:MAG: hypothetical protein ACTTJ4_02665 [Treponema sp.]|uniref:hypothetical protein n=1 Tax=Treponema sp. TaxID=166 RepID=UPI003FA249FB
MKDIRRMLLIPLIFLLTAVFCFSDALTDGIYARERLMQVYRDEIATASANEISASAIGEWYEIIETSLFMLMRRTELFRGSMRLIITDQQNARCMLYPDGTFLISTGLLDYIDSLLFTDISGSARRIRSFNTERENFFAPIAAVYAAQFALNYYSTAQNTALSQENISTIDILASVLLDIAGYPQSLLEVWLNRLVAIQKDSSTARLFRSFETKGVSAQDRLDQLYNNSEAVTHLYEEVSGVLFALQNRKGTADARTVLENLLQLFPDSLYINRLNALISHQAWLASLDKRDQELATILPAAVYDNAAVFSFFQAADFMREDEETDDEESDYFSKTMPAKGNSKIYNQAKKAYNDYLSLMYEAGTASSYAHLLASSPLAHERATVLSIAEQADLFHAGADDKSARANYAALLYLVGKDYTKAQLLLTDCLTGSAKKNSKKLFLTTGFPADERLIRCNYFRILKKVKDKTGAAEERKWLADILKEPEEETPIILRNVSLDTSVDDLLLAWNQPSTIIYNYYSERWLYRLLNTEVIIRAKNEGGVVLQISVGFPSSLTLFNDIRTGDTAEAFEKLCGKPLYRSCDALVYHRKGNVLHVIYGNSKIRNVTIRKINQ